jgi:hypothetical protein
LNGIEELIDWPGLAEDDRRVAERILREVESAETAGMLSRDLLGDAFGVAAWAIEAAPGTEPNEQRVALLADERLRFVISRSWWDEPEPVRVEQPVYA